MFGVGPRSNALFPLSQLGGTTGLGVPVERHAAFAGRWIKAPLRHNTRRDWGRNLHHDRRRGLCHDMRGIQDPRDEIAHAHHAGPLLIRHFFVLCWRVLMGMSQPCSTSVWAELTALSPPRMELGP